jgi:hypothetical protein
VIAQVTDGAAVSTGDSPTSGAAVASRSRRPVHPAVWAISGALVLAALVLPFLGLTPVAMVVGLAGLFGLGIGLWRTFGPATSLPSRSEGRMGHGPYTRTSSEKSEQLVARLRETMEELRQAAVEEDWSIDWPAINRRCEAAQKASRSRDHQTALQDYSHAISQMMKEIREQRRKRKSDSAVDLF